MTTTTTIATTPTRAPTIAGVAEEAPDSAVRAAAELEVVPGSVAAVAEFCVVNVVAFVEVVGVVVINEAVADVVGDVVAVVEVVLVEAVLVNPVVVAEAVEAVVVNTVVVGVVPKAITMLHTAVCWTHWKQALFEKKI